MKTSVHARILLLGALLLPATAQAQPAPVSVELYRLDGLKPERIEAVEVGDSLGVGLRGLKPGQGVELFLEEEGGGEWSYARLFGDGEGRVLPTLFWYQSGVIGTTSRELRFRPKPAFTLFEEAERHFKQQQRLQLSVRDLEGRTLGKIVVPVRPRSTPLLYPSNKAGVLLNAANVESDDLYATGANFPAGATVHLYVVPNRRQWSPGDRLDDQTGGPQGEDPIETVQLAPGQTRFTARVWDHRLARPGAYDLVARVGERGRPLLRANDVLAFAEDTALVYYIIVNGNVVIDSAGRMKSSPAYFEFSDGFEKGEDVYAAVDPTDVPATHAGGSYAAYWVVEHQPPAYWDAPAPPLVDVSGGVEIHRVKFWCINATRRLVWSGATQPDPIKDYDLIVDFGAVPATDSASFVMDNTYDKGLDFIDGYGQPGFTVFENPGSWGPFPVGQVELNQPNGISGITDPSGVSGPTQNVTLAWARIMYPATATGTGTPVNPAQASYPVALFLHGRHLNCDNDGAGPGLAGSMSFSCPAANRIPSHEGYNYIMERLASQGIFCISISAHDIQPGLGIWDYDARGRLILKFLDKLRSWNTAGTDPFGGIFFGRINMSKIALSGHSRGGEGVVAADALNLTWPTPHSIVGVNAIAPTDQNATSFLITRAPYFLLIGARDGDVSNMQGFRTYDRAFPEGAVPRHDKSVAWVYGANHNYFNTIWTNTAALGSPNPWAGSTDDGSGFTSPQVLTAAEQRAVGLATVAAFFRRALQGIDGYKEVLTGRLRPAGLPNDFVFWTFQDAQRHALDNFEQMPLNPGVNSLGGAAMAPGFTTFEERLLNNGSTDYPGPLPTDSQFFHDTLGLRLGWGGANTYTSELPAGQRDVSAFTHLTLRAAKKVTGAPVAGPDLDLEIDVEDGAGHHSMWPMHTSHFDRIPHPYQRCCGAGCASCGSTSNQALLTGVRIPLRSFTKNNSGVDLTDLARITVRVTGAGEIGVDDIEFGK